MTTDDETDAVHAVPSPSDAQGFSDTAVVTADADRLARLRTALAAERTVFAVVRTGLAIAGGGAVIVTLLGNRWPALLQAVLAPGFVVPGYVLMLDGLSRYRRVAGSLRPRIPTITGWCRRG